MLPLMSEDLAAGVQHVVTMGPDAVDMVAGLAEPTVAVRTCFVLHVFLEAILGESFVFYVISLVFFCGGRFLVISIVIQNVKDFNIVEIVGRY